MKFKKLFALTLVLCSVILSSCQNEKGKLPEEKDDVATAKKTDVVEQSGGEEKSDKENVNNETTPKMLIESFGAIPTESGRFNSDAVAFCEAIVSANCDIIAQYTGGNCEYYDFIGNITFDGYSIQPFEYTAEKTESMIQNGKYPRADDFYLVSFDVSKSDNDSFPVGKPLYLLGFTEEAFTGFGVKVFSLVEDGKDDVAFDNTNYVDETQSYIMNLINEFYPLYVSFGTDSLYDGKNYPETFDFSNQFHLITHIMAKSEKFGNPPYSLSQINDFISNAFNGNSGLDPVADEEALEDWLYPFSDELEDKDRIYGCSFAHGGKSAESRLISVESYETSAVYTVVLYADFAHFAEAKTLKYYFDLSDDKIPCLTMIYQTDNTGRTVATISV